MPLATGQFDNSIHLSIARETSDRLEVKGFERAKLAAALELDKKHPDQELFENPTLVTTLCERAYAYLQNFGIKYVLLVLDELETAGEASTYGIEEKDMKYLDGRAIKMIGAAIKEEDPRRKLPWLRYLALCSPVIGHELREIQSLARRFELMELQANAFSDVSDFVRKLGEQGRLSATYPQGSVEAAYSMSAGNFGWFNVLMANVETKLQELGGGVSLGRFFSETARSSSRISDHVLDTKSLDQLTLPATYKPQGAEFLFGQLPRPLAGMARASSSGARAPLATNLMSRSPACSTRSCGTKPNARRPCAKPSSPATARAGAAPMSPSRSTCSSSSPTSALSPSTKPPAPRPSAGSIPCWFPPSRKNSFNWSRRFIPIPLPRTRPAPCGSLSLAERISRIPRPHTSDRPWPCSGA